MRRESAVELLRTGGHVAAMKAAEYAIAADERFTGAVADRAADSRAASFLVRIVRGPQGMLTR